MHWRIAHGPQCMKALGNAFPSAPRVGVSPLTLHAPTKTLMIYNSAAKYFNTIFEAEAFLEQSLERCKSLLEGIQVRQAL